MAFSTFELLGVAILDDLNFITWHLRSLDANLVAFEKTEISQLTLKMDYCSPAAFEHPDIQPWRFGLVITLGEDTRAGTFVSVFYDVMTKLLRNDQLL